jgi:hypothetical protein
MWVLWALSALVTSRTFWHGSQSPGWNLLSWSQPLLTAFRGTPRTEALCLAGCHPPPFLQMPRGFLVLFSILLLCIWVFFLSVCPCTTCVQWTREPGKGIGLPEIGDTDGCEPPCACREMNPGPLKSSQCPFFVIVCFLFCFVLFFETGFLCVGLAVLELTL